MHKRTLALLLAASFVPLVSHADIRPVASLSYGVDYVHSNTEQQSITLQSPFQDTFISPNQTHNGPVAGIFLGIETPLQWNLLGQVGLSYSQPQVLNMQGTIWQFGNPSYNNKNYQNKIKSQQFLIEVKLLTTIHTQYLLHPYILAGIGESINQSYAYSETALAPYVVVNPQPFANHTSHSFTYAVGMGIDVDVTAHVRAGASFRQTELGNAALGVMPNQVSTNVISYNKLRTSEFLFNLTYVG